MTLIGALVSVTFPWRAPRNALGHRSTEEDTKRGIALEVGHGSRLGSVREPSVSSTGVEHALEELSLIPYMFWTAPRMPDTTFLPRTAMRNISMLSVRLTERLQA